MIKAGLWAGVALAWATTGCVGGEDDPKGTEYGPLFTATSAQVTPNSIYGVWSGHIETAGASSDVRIAFSRDMVASANRCSFPADGFSVIVGIKVAATVTGTEVTINESKEDLFYDGKHRCTVSVQAARSAYVIDGTRMMSGELALTKVSD